MTNFNKLVTYHGTSDLVAEELVSGKIDIRIGGGELGQGFYLSMAIQDAKAWAVQKHGCETVVEFQMDEVDFYNFDIKCLDYLETILLRFMIKRQGQTRTYKFNKDIVWGPIVGGSKVRSDQHKWESSEGEYFLNSVEVFRRKI